MRFYTLFFLFTVLSTFSRAQDRVILNNGDTIKAKINRQDNLTVDYQREGESLNESLSTRLISSMILGSGRVIKPEVLEKNKIEPVFGFHAGKVLLTEEQNSYGLPHLKSGGFEELIPENIFNKIRHTAEMIGASLVTYKLLERPMGQPQRVTCEYYAFASPSPSLIKDNIIGKTLSLASLDNYMVGQYEMVTNINRETLHHSLQFSPDGKIIENGKEAGNYTLKGEEMELTYNYTNKRGKPKEWSGIYRVGSFSKHFIQLWSSNRDLSYFMNIILEIKK